MLTRYIVIVLSIALFILPTSAQAQSHSDYLGRWVTPGGRSVIEIAPCENQPDNLCGTIIWTNPEEWEDGTPPVDENNPDPALRDRPIEGIKLISGFKPSKNGWKDGEIYNPDDGKTYDSKLKLRDNGHLKVSGCVLFFCQSQDWVSAEGFSGVDYPVAAAED